MRGKSKLCQPLIGVDGWGAFFMALDGISLRVSDRCNADQLFDANSEQVILNINIAILLGNLAEFSEQQHGNGRNNRYNPKTNNRRFLAKDPANYVF